MHIDLTKKNSKTKEAYNLQENFHKPIKGFLSRTLQFRRL